ncbi:MAG: o-succinylbenzoate synthase [Acidobacteria bacterium]|nr:o-succinylbenzoate synthase [Acidobacteriota bacterium]
MKIESLALRELKMRLRFPFETSFGVTLHRSVLLVEVEADGVTGWGEITATEGPFYNSETTATAWHVLGDYIAPFLVGKEIQAASDVPALLEFIRGHEMTKAGVENALWDAEARQKGIPLSRLLGGTLSEIACGVSLGIQETPEKLMAKIEQELAAGYQRIKLKIKPGKDLAYVSEARQRHPHILLSVDANSAYRLKDSEHLKKFDAFDLLMMEQPLEWDDIFSHSQLQAQIKTAICLDECIRNANHARAAIEIGACRILNIKLGRVGGHTEARKIQALAQERGVPVWCGGMLESGIGRAHNIAMSTLPNFRLPGDVSASRRYWEEDIIEPEVEVSAQGTIRVPETPGLGYEPRRSKIEQLTVKHKVWNSRVAVTT